MLNIAAFIGEPLNFKNKIKVYPPSIRDAVTNPKFGTYQQILTTSQDDIQYELKKDGKELEIYPTPFEFLLLNCYHSEQFKQLALEAFEFFCHVKVDFSVEKKLIIIENSEENSDATHLSEEEFFDFQNIVRQALGEKLLSPPEPINPKEDPRIRAIKEKAKERDRIKARQQAKNGISFQACLTAICCMGIGITPLNLGEMSYAAVGSIMRTMQDKEKYDIDIRSLLAGANSKKIKPKYWIGNAND